MSPVATNYVLLFNQTFNKEMGRGGVGWCHFNWMRELHKFAPPPSLSIRSYCTEVWSHQCLYCSLIEQFLYPVHAAIVWQIESPLLILEFRKMLYCIEFVLSEIRFVRKHSYWVRVGRSVYCNNIIRNILNRKVNYISFSSHLGKWYWHAC